MSGLDIGSLSCFLEFRNLLHHKHLTLQSISNSIFTVLRKNQTQIITHSEILRHESFYIQARLSILVYL